MPTGIKPLVFDFVLRLFEIFVKSKQTANQLAFVAQQASELMVSGPIPRFGDKEGYDPGHYLRVFCLFTNDGKDNPVSAPAQSPRIDPPMQPTHAHVCLALMRTCVHAQVTKWTVLAFKRTLSHPYQHYNKKLAGFVVSSPAVYERFAAWAEGPCSEDCDTFGYLLVSLAIWLRSPPWLRNAFGKQQCGPPEQPP